MNEMEQDTPTAEAPYREALRAIPENVTRDECGDRVRRAMETGEGYRQLRWDAMGLGVLADRAYYVNRLEPAAEPAVAARAHALKSLHYGGMAMTAADPAEAAYLYGAALRFAGSAMQCLKAPAEQTSGA